MPQNPRKAHISLQEALEVIKANGLALATPNTITKAKILAESQTLLGVKEPPKTSRYGPAKRKKEPKNPPYFEIHLSFPHTIGTQRYGPGLVSIPWEQRELVPLLQQQDQVALRHQLETLSPRQPRCYMIVDTHGAFGAKNTAIEVDERAFMSQTIIHSEITPLNADYLARGNRSIMEDQGRIVW